MEIIFIRCEGLYQTINADGAHRTNKDLWKGKIPILLRLPPVQTYYCLNDELGYGEVDIPQDIIKEEIQKLLPHHYEFFIVKLIAEVLGGILEKTQKDEIDGIVRKKKETIAIIEVKMGEITRHDVNKLIAKIKKLGIKTNVITVARNRISKGSVISLTPQDVVEIAKNPKIMNKLIDKI